MRRLKIMGLLSALYLIVAGSAAQAAEGDVVGKVLRLKSSAVAMQDAMPRPLTPGSDVLVNDVISTGAGARLEFSLRDGSVITLGERATFAVSDFEDTPARESIALRLLSGAFKAA
ncbi:MAG: FecR domain-containing protein, partial [Rhodospirillales bacterium]